MAGRDASNGTLPRISSYKCRSGTDAALLLQAIEATTTLVELYDRVRKKLDLVGDFLLAYVQPLGERLCNMLTVDRTARRFREADGTRVVLKDDEDWQCELLFVLHVLDRI